MGILLEAFSDFIVDDKDDAKLYNAKKMAKAIADAIGKA